MLAIWNGIRDGFEDEFLHWHVREHIPERVVLPGFMRGRRYAAFDGHPSFFNFYETRDVSDLSSDAYRAELDRPSQWTQSVVRNFTDTSRTICEVAASIGHGEGVVMETLRLGSTPSPDAFRERMIGDLLMPVSAMPGVVGVHLLRGLVGADRRETAEMRLRGGIDEVADWIVLIEAVQSDVVAPIRDDLLSEEKLIAAGAGGTFRRGAYALQYSLSKFDLEHSESQAVRPRAANASSLSSGL